MSTARSGRAPQGHGTARKRSPSWPSPAAPCINQCLIQHTEDAERLPFNHWDSCYVLARKINDKSPLLPTSRLQLPSGWKKTLWPCISLKYLPPVQSIYRPCIQFKIPSIQASGDLSKGQCLSKPIVQGRFFKE